MGEGVPRGVAPGKFTGPPEVKISSHYHRMPPSPHAQVPVGYEPWMTGQSHRSHCPSKEECLEKPKVRMGDKSEWKKEDQQVENSYPCGR